MRDLEYMLERISLWEKLPVLLLDAEDHVIPWRDNILDVEGWYGENPDLMDLLLHYLNGHRQTIYQEQEIFAYAAVEDEETGERCILGPVVLEKNFHGSIRNYRNVGAYLPEDGKLPCVSLEYLINCVELLYFAIHHEQLDEREMLEKMGGQISDKGAREWDVLSYEIRKSEEERIPLPYQIEQRWTSALEQGEEYRVNYPDVISRVGEMARSGKKQLEYTFVVSITLAARAAIRGGVPPAVALELADVWLQKLEQCRDEIQMHGVNAQAMNDFLEHVQAVKKNDGEPAYIRDCKDYIARHRTGKIDLNAMAEELHISYGYLSRKFREIVGMTVQQYILKEKIRAAANMIRYSDIPLSEIANYLDFSSQSHMGTYFKKEYHMTPNEYRKRFQ